MTGVDECAREHARLCLCGVGYTFITHTLRRALFCLIFASFSLSTFEAPPFTFPMLLTYSGYYCETRAKGKQEAYERQTTVTTSARCSFCASVLQCFICKEENREVAPAGFASTRTFRAAGRWTADRPAATTAATTTRVTKAGRETHYVVSLEIRAFYSQVGVFLDLGVYRTTHTQTHTHGLGLPSLRRHSSSLFTLY